MAGYGFASNPPYGLRRLRAFPDCPTGKSPRLFAGVHSTLHGVVFAIFCPGPAVHPRRNADGYARP
jgi:hypothetical protein